MHTIKRGGIGLMLALALLVGLVSPAEAQTTQVSVQSGDYQSLITFDTPVPRREADQLKSAMAPVGAMLNCDHYYPFYDTNGRYTIQRACGRSRAPWSFQISPSVQSIVVGLVRERGMAWKRNGVSQPMQKWHTETADYLFHGTYSGLADMYNVQYQDVFTFRHNLGSGGTATLTITGDHTFTGNRG